MIALPSPLAPLSRLLQPLASVWAPAWVQDAWPQAAQSKLTSCLLLALLLHLWLVLMLGNAPPGTAPPGQGVWGALNVTLRGPAQDGPVAVVAPPMQPAGMPGTAASPRAGGTVRAPSPQPLPDPGSARLGDWAQTPAPAVEMMSPVESPTGPIRLPTPAAAVAPPLPAWPDPPAAPAAAPVQTTPATPVAEPAVTPPAQPAAAAPAEPLPAVAAAPVLRQVAPTVPSALSPALSPVQRLPAQAPVVVHSLPAGPAGQPMAALPAGRPDAGSQVGHDVATAPSAPASAPRLNLELARPRGGELSRQGGAGVLPLLPRPPELPDKLARDIDKSGKADCRKAYQNLGLLAVVPLAADAVRGGKDSGCKW